MVCGTQILSGSFVGSFCYSGASSYDLTHFRNDERWAHTHTVHQVLKYAARALDDTQMTQPRNILMRTGPNPTRRRKARGKGVVGKWNSEL